jgi:hypothetical protein
MVPQAQTLLPMLKPKLLLMLPLLRSRKIPSLCA